VVAKRILWILLAAALVAYLYWPYRVSARLEAALHSANEAELAELIDFPAVRLSLKEQFLARIRGGEAPPAGDSADRVSELLVEKLVDSAFTPSALAASQKLASTGGFGWGHARIGEKAWSGFNEFSAKLGDNTRLRFRLSDRHGWRVVALEMNGEIPRGALR
jgi:hypothetical protein